MKLTSPRVKSLTVTAGLSFWFAIISLGLNKFSIEALIVFVTITLIITQIFSSKISKVLDVFAIFNTKFFLGILFIFVISIYGILFKILRIDLLRLKKQNKSYWLDLDNSTNDTMEKQF